MRDLARLLAQIDFLAGQLEAATVGAAFWQEQAARNAGYSSVRECLRSLPPEGEEA